MKDNFSREKILKSVIGPYDYHCSSHLGKENYILTPVMAIESVKETFSHPGSNVLDSILAYDKAETTGAYIGQINMINVSSFCGPQGLLWGYDLAKETKLQLTFLSNKNLGALHDVKIRSGENLRSAAKALLGTKEEKHFPFFPGSHVPCAGRFLTKSGPTNLYGAFGIGIPEKREKDAIVVMEDAGELTVSNNSVNSIREKIIMNVINSVLAVGKNQRINYKEIFVDFILKEIKADEVGCVLIAAPYFQLARKAANDNLINQTLEEWLKCVKNNFSKNRELN